MHAPEFSFWALIHRNRFLKGKSNVVILYGCLVDVIAHINQEKLRKALILSSVYFKVIYNKVIALRTLSQQSKQRGQKDKKYWGVLIQKKFVKCYFGLHINVNLKLEEIFNFF